MNKTQMTALTYVDADCAPVTEPYIRDLMLEAHRLVTAKQPHCVDFKYIEIFEDIMFGRDQDCMIIYYNPNVLRDLSLNDICQCLAQVLHDYTMYLAEEHAPEEGTTFH